jgi:hypothetical protein
MNPPTQTWSFPFGSGTVLPDVGANRKTASVRAEGGTCSESARTQTDYRVPASNGTASALEELMMSTHAQ